MAVLEAKRDKKVVSFY